MSAMDIFWLFVMLAAVQPWLKHRTLEAARRRLIARIEKTHGSRLILLVHRQETMSFLGFPLMRYIDLNDWEDLVRAIHLTDPEVPIDLVLHTPGGLALASLQIARAIKMHPGRVRVFVPHYAMSGGTLIALAADEIVMSEHAVLGPVDPQVGKVPASSLLKVVEKKAAKDLDDQTLILVDQAEKAIGQMRDSVKELLAGGYPPDKAAELAELLSTGTWTHDYPITPMEARKLGLRVSSDMPKQILELMDLFPQPVRHQPTVEYLPVPRHFERPRPGEG